MALPVRLRDVSRGTWLLAAAHLVFTAVLLYQHALGWHWDFLVYSMNAEYLFHNGAFMEWARPPIVPLLIGVLRFALPGGAAEYGFILASSAVFLYAVHRFAASVDVDRLVLYTLLVTPGMVAAATRAGTELLSLAFLLLFLADRDRGRGGVWLGLAALTRYTNALLLPLVLVQPRRARLRSAGWAVLPAVPWLAYTWAVTGDALTSPVSFAALNVVLRQETAAAGTAA
ncbi:MAG: hypothetical protein ABEI97_05500, partial [Candidatus Nanohaloarchaea archaeon]